MESLSNLRNRESSKSCDSMFPAVFNPLNRPARDQKSGVARIRIGGPIIRDSRRTTRNRKLVKTAWALARASWHLASARLGTLALGPYVWERRLSGFRPTHGRRFRANNCLPFSLSLSPSLLLLLCLPSNSRTTIHSFDIFSTTFFLFFSFLSHGKSSDLRIRSFMRRWRNKEYYFIHRCYVILSIDTITFD